jgi:hypothetical protein
LKTFGGPIRVLSGIFRFAKQFNLSISYELSNLIVVKQQVAKRVVRVKGKTGVFLVLRADSTRFY